jgi:hypothetical protein
MVFKIQMLVGGKISMSASCLQHVICINKYGIFHMLLIIIERPRRRWEDNIKMDLQEVGGGCGDWMELAQDRNRWRALVSTVRNLRVPKMRGIS